MKDREINGLTWEPNETDLIPGVVEDSFMPDKPFDQNIVAASIKVHRAYDMLGIPKSLDQTKRIAIEALKKIEKNQ